MIYEVEFPDGQTEEYAANMIAVNMLTQDEDGYLLTMLDGIIDHHEDEEVAVPKAEKHAFMPGGQRRPRKTIAGWSLLVKWADESESWIPLKD
jgi:hypothetical protein